VGEDRTDAHSGGRGSDRLTIAEAAALLGVHKNTVRNRIRNGLYRAEMVQTERGPTYLIERESLLTNLSTNTLSSASQELVSQQAMEFVQELLRPFVSELGEIREELGAERVRREMAESTLRAGMAEEQRRREEAERERDDLRRELYALREARESPQTVEDQPERAEEPRSDTEGAQGGTERPQQRHGWREPLDKLPWWQYVLGLFLVFSAGLLASIVAENLALRFDTPIFVGVLILGAIVWSTPGIFGFWVGYRKRNLRLRSQVLPLGVLVSGVALLGAHGEQLLLTFAALNYINLRDLLLYFSHRVCSSYLPPLSETLGNVAEPAVPPALYPRPLCPGPREQARYHGMIGLLGSKRFSAGPGRLSRLSLPLSEPLSR
jgi:excisionase family DNA binding protein